MVKGGRYGMLLLGIFSGFLYSEGFRVMSVVVVLVDLEIVSVSLCVNREKILDGVVGVRAMRLIELFLGRGMFDIYMLNNVDDRTLP